MFETTLRRRVPVMPGKALSVKGGMADAGADRHNITRHGQFGQFRDAVDIDEMGRAGHAEGHGRHQCLPPGKNSSVLRCISCDKLYRLLDRRRRVVTESCRLHCASARLDGS